MNKEVEYIRCKIKENGYLSATRVTLMLLKYSPKLKIENIKQILAGIVGDGIHKIEYTNRYVVSYTTKELYLYNPSRLNKSKAIKKTRKKAARKPKVKNTNN